MTIWDTLSGQRDEFWTVDLLDQDDNLIRTLPRVVSCKVDADADRQYKTAGSVTIEDADIDWGSVRLQPWVHVNNVRWPLGVLLPASPEETITETGSTWTVPLVDKLAVLDQDAMTEPYSLAAGSNVISTVAHLITQAGETRVAVTDSPVVTTSLMVWPVGTSRLTIINDLLQFAGYWSIWVDRFGLYRVEPYVEPAHRPVAYTMTAGVHLVSGDWTRTQDTLSVYNRVVLLTSSTADQPALIGIAQNTDPASPYSIPSRGRPISRPPETVEAVDQATIDALARRRLLEASSPAATISVQHALYPVDLNAIVQYQPADGRSITASINSWSVSSEIGSLVTAKWTEVTA